MKALGLSPQLKPILSRGVEVEHSRLFTNLHSNGDLLRPLDAEGSWMLNVFTVEFLGVYF